MLCCAARSITSFVIRKKRWKRTPHTGDARAYVRAYARASARLYCVLMWMSVYVFARVCICPICFIFVYFVLIVVHSQNLRSRCVCAQACGRVCLPFGRIQHWFRTEWNELVRKFLVQIDNTRTQIGQWHFPYKQRWDDETMYVCSLVPLINHSV